VQTVAYLRSRATIRAAAADKEESHTMNDDVRPQAAHPPLAESLDGTHSGHEACTALSLELSGLSCNGCARAIERLTVGLPGVTRMSVEFASSDASPGSVWYDARRASADEIVGAIQRAGYGVRVRR
jgi:P-type Cu+ transporter